MSNDLSPEVKLPSAETLKAYRDDIVPLGHFCGIGGSALLGLLDLIESQARRIASLERDRKTDRECLEHYQARFSLLTDAWRKGSNDAILDAVRKHITATDIADAERLLAAVPPSVPRKLVGDIIDFIHNDAFAATWQTMGQYRGALVRHIAYMLLDSEAQPPAETGDSQ